MYCCQNTTQYPVNRIRNHMKRLLPTKTNKAKTTHIHHGTVNDQNSEAIFRRMAMPTAGKTSHAFPTTTQKLRNTVPIDGGGASPAFRGSLKNAIETKNMAKTLIADMR